MTTEIDVAIKLLVREGLRVMITIGTIREAPPPTANVDADIESARRFTKGE
jgi:hypothetical protein